MNGLRDYALKYAELGWHVFPIVPGSKSPLTKHGVKDATADEAQIREWWNRWPTANIGLACGAASGVYVIDIDVDEEKGVNGYESIQEIAGSYQNRTITQLTPGGGTHLFYATDNPPANRNGLRPGIDIRGDGYYVVLAPSIHPNGKAYRWHDGFSPWDLQPDRYPDFMRVERDRPEGVRRPNIRVQNTPGILGDALLRARCYFEQVAPAIQGNRGHDCLLWAAQCCVNGLRMSDSESYDFLAVEYNPRCVPPWDLSDPRDEKDFRRKITEARKNPTNKFPIGWILDDPAYAVQSEASLPIDRVSLIASAKVADAPAIVTSKKSRSAIEANRIPDELRWPTGWLGEYIGYCMRYAPYPNWPLACAGGLALGSAVAGRKVAGPSGLPTNLYVIGLALPGTGKNFPRTLNARILEEAGGLDILADKLASAEGLEDRIAERPHVLLCQPDEMDSLLYSFEQGRDGRSMMLGALLLQLYTSSGGIYVRRVKSIGSDTTRQEPIIRPHVSLFGTATPRLYYEACGRRLLEGGFAARVLIFEADKRGRGRNDKTPDLPQSLIEWPAYWLGYAPDGAGDIAAVNDSASKAVTAIQASESGLRALSECQQQADDEYGVAERTANAGAAAIWSRIYEQVEKVSTIQAIGHNRDNPLITDEIVRWATALVRFSAKNALALANEYSSDTPFARKCQDVVKALRDAGGSLPQREVLRRLKLKLKDLDDLSSSLRAQGLIDLVAVQNKRGPATITWVVTDE